MGSTIQPVGEISSKRRYRTAEEKRRIVEETLVEGVSVAMVARRHGINANLVFNWRKLHEAGLLGPSRGLPPVSSSRLLPVKVVDEPEIGQEQNISAAAPSSGAIHIEFPGRALVSLEGRVNAAVVRAVLESLRG